jgi:hypothetical protein
MKHNTFASSKRIISGALAVILALGFSPLESKAAVDRVRTSIAPDPLSGMNVLLARLDTISEMDKTALAFSEKKELRSEVRSISKRMHDNYGGVYISAGGLLIIILLLIILL